MRDRLIGKVALITGGAGSIGAAAARAFLAEGAQVMIVDVVPDGLLLAAEELGSASLAYRVVDVTNEEQVRGAVRATVERFGRLDVAFANAGVFGVVAPVVEYPLDTFASVIAINVIGSFLVAKHALAAMAPGGSLIVNSSFAGLTSERGISAYTTSKHALVGLVRTAAKEVADRGIRVNSIHPGPTDNAFQHRIEVELAGASREASARAVEERIPLARHATPEEIAAAVVFLASDDSAFVTGTTLTIDGGLSI
jgi:NAD(P)-dependent dehydrogenase (short-subunit alcohol dehydrogenase family)